MPIHGKRPPRSVAAACGLIAAALLVPTSARATHRLGSVISDGTVIGPATGAVFVLEDDDLPRVEFFLLHFRSSLSGTDQLVVDLGNDEQDVFDAGSPAEFWTRPVKPDVDNAVTLTYLDVDGDGAGSVTLLEYGRGEYRDEAPDGDIDGGLEGTDLFLLESPFQEPDFSTPQCGAGGPSWENVACLDPADSAESVMRQAATGVGIIVAVALAAHAGVECLPGETACVSSCTAAWIGNGQVLTAGHCFATDADVESASFTVDFQTGGDLATCDQGLRPADYAPHFYRVERVASTGWFGCPRLDYSVLEIDAPAGIGADALEILDHDETDGTELFVVHHPRGSTKKVSSQHTDPPDSECVLDEGGAGDDFDMLCDLDHGSSGSPVFNLDGQIVGISKGGGCLSGGSNVGAYATPATDDAACHAPPPFDYELTGLTTAWDAGDPPLLAGESLPDLRIDYGLAAAGGYRCGSACYEHMAWMADTADLENPVEVPLSWYDFQYLRPGEVVSRALQFQVPCPDANGDSYKLVVELNHLDAAPEADLADNRIVSDDTFTVCYPDLGLTLNGLFEAVGCDAGACDATCDPGPPTTLCDGGDCDDDRCIVADVTFCNTGCGDAEIYNIDLTVEAQAYVIFDGLAICSDVGDPLHVETHFDGAGLDPGSAEDPTCRTHQIPFRVPDYGADALLQLGFCTDVYTEGPVRDCSPVDDTVCDPVLEPVDCIDPDCIFDDSCLCVEEGEDLCTPDDDDDGDGGDCFEIGCFPRILDCCSGGSPQPCWAFFPGGGLLCGDPRVGELLLFDQAMQFVIEATDPASVAQALGAVSQRIDELPFGANMTLPLRYLAEAEIASLAGRADVFAADLEWVHRLSNAFDLDLRTMGLEVPVSVPAGTNVSVSLGGGITLSFDSVQAPGTVTPRFRQFVPPLPSGFHAPVPFYAVDLENTAALAPASGVTVTMDYSALAFRPGAAVHVFHEEQGSLVDRTLTSNPSAHTVTGRVNGFSRFMLLGEGGVTSIGCPPGVVLQCPADTSPGSTGSASASGNGGPITIAHADRIVQQQGSTISIRRRWTASDGWSGALCTQTIDVVDTASPAIVCPSPGSVVVGCAVGGQSYVSMPVATASDACDGPTPITNDRTPGGADASGYYPLGQTVVTFSTHDAAGHPASCQLLVTVEASDSDGDGHGNACDCAPGDPGAWAAPLEATGLSVARSALGPDHVAASWDSLAAQAGPGVAYDVLTGGLAALRGSGSFAERQCLATNLAATNLDAAQAIPPAGDGYWYLVRAENPCGSGTWGSGSALDAAQLCSGSPPNLTLSKSDSPDPVVVGREITYGIAYSNTGGDDATGVLIQDALPGNTTFVSATGGGSLQGGVVTWNVGALPAGSSGTVQLVVRVSATVQPGTVISNSCSIDSDQTAPATSPPATTTTVGLPLMAIDLDIATPTTVDPVRLLPVTTPSLDVGIVVDARNTGGLGDVLRVAFGAINVFNTGGATVASITPLAIVDLMPPTAPPYNATFSSLSGEFQFGMALVERGLSGSSFSDGPLQYARLRVFFGNRPPGSTIRLFIGDQGAGSPAVRNAQGVPIGGDATPDGTAIFGTPGSDEGSAAGMNYQDALIRF